MSGAGDMGEALLRLVEVDYRYAGGQQDNSGQVSGQIGSQACSSAAGGGLAGCSLALAAHPRIESLSFGLMDFVSDHRGAIPQSGMSVKGQFEHPLVMRAKLEISAACHGWGKVPSHCVVTEFKHLSALEAAATQACRQLGYTRMWSIHPDQIRTIVDAFSPTTAEVDQAAEILLAAQAAGWGPIRHRHHGQDTLHDRASFRYFWHVLERAHRTGPLPAEIERRFFARA